MKNAKIIATLGPSSSDVATIVRLIGAGMNVARINMGHGSHETHHQLITNIRQASQQVGREIGILVDLQGPKIRTDKVPQPLAMGRGEEWVIGPTPLQKDFPEYSGRFIPTVYENLVADVKIGDRILFDDGLIVAKAIGKDRNVLKILLEVGGILKSNKGINLPDTVVSEASFTEKDQEDLAFALKEEIDFVALSFVQRKDDILHVKYMLHKQRLSLPVVAKIENPEGLRNLDEIIQYADMIMVARGDMGVEVGNHLVPAIQKQIIRKCNHRGVPVITATQMLESMVFNSTPTRAEASDVANAIWDGSDAVMLSGETAAGKYPVETVQMMGQIIKEAEKVPRRRRYVADMEISNIPDAIMMSASMMAEKVGAQRIVCVTESGRSPQVLAKFRPRVPVIGVTCHLNSLRRMSLMWGVYAYLLDENDLKSNLEYALIEKVQAHGKFKSGDKVVLARGDGKFISRDLANSVTIEILKNLPGKELRENQDPQSPVIAVEEIPF